MKKLTDALNGIKHKFCQQQHFTEGTSVGCVEVKDAARRTCGSTGKQNETNHFMKYNVK
jgi:hypothetical protein